MFIKNLLIAIFILPLVSMAEAQEIKSFNGVEFLEKRTDMAEISLDNLKLIKLSEINVSQVSKRV